MKDFLQFPMLGWQAGGQELGGSTARQPAQAGQWQYSILQASCSVYKWGLAGGQEPL